MMINNQNYNEFLRKELVNWINRSEEDFSEQEYQTYLKQQEIGMDVTGSLGCWGVSS